MARHTRRDFLKAAAAGIAPLAVPGCAGRPLFTRQMKRPNILFLFADDQRFDTIGALGNSEIITPNLDSLAQKGTAFTNAYIMGSMSGAVCVPSRAMLMTGRTLFHLENVGAVIPESHVTLPEMLRSAGYVTFHTGKWHQDKATHTRCFSDAAKIFFGGMTDQFAVPVFDFDPTGRYPKENGHIEEGKHSSELFSDTAIEFLRNHKGDKPFFLYVAYTAPHDPRVMPKQYQAMYLPEKVGLPKSFMPQHPFDNGEMKVRDEMLASWPRTEAEIRRHIAAYHAMITHLDAQIGRVLAVLKETGRAEDTIVIFAGDNGLAVGRHGLMGKQNLYEHSIHVPLMICGPGIPKGQNRDAFCYLLDVFPTVCELTGEVTPGTVEGCSLVPVLCNRMRSVRQILFFAYKGVQRAVRDERFKLIEYKVAGKRTTQLFDLKTDPWEINNLADDPRHGEDLQRLRIEMLRLKNELGDTGEFWQGYPA